MGPLLALAAFDALAGFFVDTAFLGLTGAAGFADVFFLTGAAFGDDLAFGTALPGLTTVLLWAVFFVEPAFTVFLKDFRGVGADLGAAVVFALGSAFFFFTAFFIILPA